MASWCGGQSARCAKKRLPNMINQNQSEQHSEHGTEIKTRTPDHPTRRALRKLIPMLFVANACLAKDHWIYIWIVMAYTFLWFNELRCER